MAKDMEVMKCIENVKQMAEEAIDQSERAK